MTRTIMICAAQGDQVKGDEVEGHVARAGDKRNLYRVLWGKDNTWKA